MTPNMMNLRALMEKSPDADFPREMIGYGVQRLMELEVGGVTGAAHGEKSAERLGSSRPFPHAWLAWRRVRRLTSGHARSVRWVTRCD